ncbi:MAG: hypothetical protein JXR40_00065 [Pontiellaceae bacterium]|nr:hypothetical protein [Pontiellaceae bacterium]
MSLAHRGKVPQFSLRPHPAITTSLILVPIIGLLAAGALFQKDVGTGDLKQAGILVLIITGILFLILLIGATYKLWFPHLWKRNSSHNRHHHHSEHHPYYRDREIRDRNRRR